jgi:hypothetical protein
MTSLRLIGNVKLRSYCFSTDISWAEFEIVFSFPEKHVASCITDMQVHCRAKQRQMAIRFWDSFHPGCDGDDI